MVNFTGLVIRGQPGANFTLQLQVPALSTTVPPCHVYVHIKACAAGQATLQVWLQWFRVWGCAAGQATMQVWLQWFRVHGCVAGQAMLHVWPRTCCGFKGRQLDLGWAGARVGLAGGCSGLGIRV
jgi:hypothetical protein